VAGKRLRAVQGEVGGLVEGDVVPAAEADAVAGADGGQDSWDAVGVDGVRLLAGQAEQDGLVGAVADAGQCE
jgi:hypothetical protein